MTNHSTAERPPLTDEQLAALACELQTVSLAAGAGCGKTFVLTERFVSLLDPHAQQPLDLHQLVAITFTDAAAREMRQRIRRRCTERFQQAEDSAERQHWKQLLGRMDQAQISTIHSYCAALLRMYAAEAGVDPRFEMLDPSAADLLRIQAVDDRLRQLLLEGDRRVIDLAAHFSLHALRNDVARLLSDASPRLLARFLDLSPEELVAVWNDHYEQVVVPAELAATYESEQLSRLVHFCRHAEIASPKLAAHLSQLLEAVDRLPDSTNPASDLHELRELAKLHGPPRSRKNWASQQQYEEFRDLAKAFREEVLAKSMLNKPRDRAEQLASATLGLELMRLVADVAGHYASAKQARNALEFDDLLDLAHRLLRDSAFAEVQQNALEHTKYLLVDEFQDTDPLQVEIVKRLRGLAWATEGLFVVGDFKQSIYRFRGAEPRVSLELRDSLPPERRLSLTTNFRSQPAILDFVNALFQESFDEHYQPLRPKWQQVSATPAVEFLWALCDPDASSEEAELPEESEESPATLGRIREARLIAHRLAELLDAGAPMVLDAQASSPVARRLRQGDIAILLRSLTDVPIYEAALQEVGLEYMLVGGHAFYAQQEIYDVLHLLRSVNHLTDELSLAGVLRSPMFSLTDETLYWLVQTGGTLSAGLFAKELPAQLTPAQRQNTRRAAEILSQLRARKDELLVAELLGEAFALTGYDALLLSEFLGERKLANLEKLLEQARAVDRLSPGDLSAFITQLSEFVVRAPKEPLAVHQTEGDVIRIMTIHNAKGLEFPLVVVPDLNRRDHLGESRPVFDEQLGPLVPTDKACKSCVGWDMYRLREKLEDQAERLRVLYVACTRAADYLILSSSIDELQKPTSSWMKFLASRFDLATGDYLNALPTGYAKPEVRVTTELPEIDRRVQQAGKGANLERLLKDIVRQSNEKQHATLPPLIDKVPVDTNARRHYSFSRLSGRLIHAVADSAEPEDENTSSLDPRGFGTLIHAALEKLDFSNAEGLEELCEFIAPIHLEQHAEQAAEEAGQLLHRFVASDRARDLRKAQRVLREVEFLLPWPRHSRDKSTYLQGYIDCLYQDAAGNWHLLDYKSNQVSMDDVQTIARQYEMQMYVYGVACRQALGVVPVEHTLYFLRPGAEYCFCWDSPAAALMDNQILQAIEQISSPGTEIELLQHGH